jgi:hypothetical protein
VYTIVCGSNCEVCPVSCEVSVDVDADSSDQLEEWATDLSTRGVDFMQMQASEGVPREGIVGYLTAPGDPWHRWGLWISNNKSIRIRWLRTGIRAILKRISSSLIQKRLNRLFWKKPRSRVTFQSYRVPWNEGADFLMVWHVQCR